MEERRKWKERMYIISYINSKILLSMIFLPNQWVNLQCHIIKHSSNQMTEIGLTF